MSNSNCCILTCIQIFSSAGQVVWYSHLFKSFPHSVVIHTVKGLGIVNKAEIDIFLELSCFFSDPTGVGNLISGTSAFSKSSLNIWKFTGAMGLDYEANLYVLILFLCESLTQKEIPCYTLLYFVPNLSVKDIPEPSPSTTFDLIISPLLPN